MTSAHDPSVLATLRAARGRTLCAAVAGARLELDATGVVQDPRVSDNTFQTV